MKSFIVLAITVVACGCSDPPQKFTFGPVPNTIVNLPPCYGEIVVERVCERERKLFGSPSDTVYMPVGPACTFGMPPLTDSHVLESVRIRCTGPRGWEIRPYRDRPAAVTVCLAGADKHDALKRAYRVFEAWSSRDEADRLAGILLSPLQDRDPQRPFYAFYDLNYSWPDSSEVAACWEEGGDQ